MNDARARVLAAVAAAIDAARRPGRPVVVGVTGIDASGKSHLTAELAALLRGRGTAVQVVHVDDFHHPDASATPQASVNRSGTCGTASTSPG